MFKWFRGTDDELMQRVNHHRDVMPVVMDFVDYCTTVVEDGKISRDDSKILMKQYWKVIKAVQSRN